jgi:RES domain-containing protein
VRLQATFYRGHDPRWASSPLSGQGASSAGGRFNPKGVAALYLASTAEGVVVEMTHGLPHRLEPLTIVSYDVDVDDITDLRTASGRHAARVTLADMSCAWGLDLSEGRQPASWRIANQLRKNSTGILVPSFANRARPEMHNLVLWKWGPNLPHRVTVYDPSGRLPKNQLSWT